MHNFIRMFGSLNHKWNAKIVLFVFYVKFPTCINKAMNLTENVFRRNNVDLIRTLLTIAFKPDIFYYFLIILRRKSCLWINIYSTDFYGPLRVHWLTRGVDYGLQITF